MAGMGTILVGSAPKADLSDQLSVSKASPKGTEDFDSYLKDSARPASQKDSVVGKKTAGDDASRDTASGSPDRYASRGKISSPAETDGLQSENTALPEEKEGILPVLKEEVKSLVKEILGIDGEELEAAMAELQAGAGDLFNPEILKQLVLQLTGGEEATEFLTNEDLMASYSQLLDALTDFAEENRQVLLSLMEVLDVPMTLEEFLNQDEVSFEELLTPQTENMPVPEVAVPEIAVSEAVQPEIVGEAAEELPAQTAGQPAAMEMPEVPAETMTQTSEETEAAPEILGQAEKLVIRTTAQERPVAETVQEEAPQDNNAQDGIEAPVVMQEEKAFSQNTGSQQQNLFQDDASSGQQTGQTVPDPLAQQETQTLFTEQFHTVQGNIADIAEPQLQGSLTMQRMVEIVDQVSTQIRNSVTAETTTMEMQLNPESLGKVYLTVASKEGVMTANFYVQSDEAKNALESQIAQLKETLEAKNLKVESVDVQISDFSFEHSNEAERQQQEELANQGRRRFQSFGEEEDSDGEEEAAEAEAEEVRRRVMRDSGSSIDFTA